MEVLAAIPILTALLEAIKKAGFPHKFIPLLAVVLGGVYANLLVGHFDVYTTLMGIVWGLSSVGLYEGVKEPISKGVTEIKKLG